VTGKRKKENKKGGLRVVQEKGGGVVKVNQKKTVSLALDFPGTALF